jgi:uncharacterized protein YecE (DUF72 family)
VNRIIQLGRVLKSNLSHVRLGTAGWAIPRDAADQFPQAGTGVARYSAVFNAAEVNSTFRKVHRPATLAKWAGSVSSDFRFSIKMPKIISHELRLRDAQQHVRSFADLARAFGPKGGPWLLQLPPSLALVRDEAKLFFAILRDHYIGPVVCEPRHPSWFEPEAEGVLRNFDISRAAASPARVAGAAVPGGSPALAYYRLHGTPRIYYSSYDTSVLKALSESIDATTAREVWCIFDNTASGAAIENALEMRTLLGIAPD